MTATITHLDQYSKIGNVQFIWARNSKEFLFANSIFIPGTHSVLVDPSAQFTTIEQLASKHAVHMIFNTHYHADHRSLNHLFTDTIFAAPSLDAGAIRDYKVYEQIADRDPHSFYTSWRKKVFQKYGILDVPVSQTYEDGDIIQTGEHEIEVIHLPGHTAGHSGLFIKNIDCLFIGDVDLTPYGPWYANINSNIDQFLESIQRLRKFSATYYVTSHGERIYDQETFLRKLQKYEDHIHKRDEHILNLLKQGAMHLSDLCQQGIIYRRVALTDPLKAYFQIQMVIKHLERLMQKNQIVLEDTFYKVIA